MKKNFLLAMLVVITLSFVGCQCDWDHENDNNNRNTTEMLCDKVWQNTVNSSREEVTTILSFNPNGSGTEKQVVIKFDSNGTAFERKEVDYPFTWLWMDTCCEGIEMKYGPKDFSYFDNVLVREHYLSGEMDGGLVVYKDTSLF